MMDQSDDIIFVWPCPIAGHEHVSWEEAEACTSAQALLEREAIRCRVAAEPQSEKTELDLSDLVRACRQAQEAFRRASELLKRN